MNLRFLLVLFTISFSYSFNTPYVSNTIANNVIVSSDEDVKILNLYKVFTNKNKSVPQLACFSKAIKGYSKLKATGKIKNETLTVIDFSLSSSVERLWVLDMVTNKVVFNTVVAHGKNTGGEFATKFSNTNNSNQSSLGFYITDTTYYGKNGLSLFLDGQEKGFNTNARKRYVVFHGAKYANSHFVKQNGRLGRSLGCPAVPTAINSSIIKRIKNKSCLFIYHPNKKYNTYSKLIS
jgi:hypothetical protein